MARSLSIASEACVWLCSARVPVISSSVFLMTVVEVRFDFEVSISTQMHSCIVLMADRGKSYILKLKEKR